ncbi:MAG: hypothetical protein JO001_22300 [Alphaproteobacteria bacterium]|nr:hypothetical protein [Alphaproteobacteria bacterium]
MLFTVEVRLIGRDLMVTMSRMRTWLDHSGVEPDAFRCSRGSPTTTIRLDFKDEGSAVSFAKTFGGRILGSLEHVYPAESVEAEQRFGSSAD